MSLKFEIFQQEDDSRRLIAKSPHLADAEVVVARFMSQQPSKYIIRNTQTGETRTILSLPMIGSRTSWTAEIINHEPDPFEIMGVENTSRRFAVETETLEPAWRYRLSLTMKGDGPAGRMADTLTVVTTSRAHPFIEVQANANLNERVHAFPRCDWLREHQHRLTEIRLSGSGGFLSKLDGVSGGGKDFRVIAQTHLPFLQLSTFQADLKDRYGIRLTLLPENLKSEAVIGTIVILSNDQEFPRVTIPVKAMVEGSW
jgi:hypothetical protein